MSGTEKLTFIIENLSHQSSYLAHHKAVTLDGNLAVLVLGATLPSHKPLNALLSKDKLD